MHLLMHRRIRLLRFSPLLAHHEKLAGHCLPCVLSCAHYVRYESKYGLLVFFVTGTLEEDWAKGRTGWRRFTGKDCKRKV
jgi:hypothetical protein